MGYSKGRKIAVMVLSGILLLIALFAPFFNIGFFGGQGWFPERPYDDIGAIFSAISNDPDVIGTPQVLFRFCTLLFALPLFIVALCRKKGGCVALSVVGAALLTTLFVAYAIEVKEIAILADPEGGVLSFGFWASFLLFIVIMAISAGIQTRPAPGSDRPFILDRVSDPIPNPVVNDYIGSEPEYVPEYDREYTVADFEGGAMDTPVYDAPVAPVAEPMTGLRSTFKAKPAVDVAPVAPTEAPKENLFRQAGDL